jgi:WS/DGAT/MGAT family acyltransferase
MSRTIPALDLMFLLTETPNSPKHVGVVMTFKLPPAGGSRLVREIVDAYRAAAPIAPFNLVPEFSLKGMPRWQVADTLDMDYHVQHIALPPDTGYEQFLKLVEALHEPVLDRNRPGFRVHVIEGLPDHAFALYLKIHHAIIDGASGVMRMNASMSETTAAKPIEPFYAIDLSSPKPRPSKGFLDRVKALQSKALTQTIAVKDLYLGLVKKQLGRLLASPRPGSEPFTAPRTPMNEPIRTPRSFATLSLPLAEMRAVGKALGGTLNDVAATITDEGLHRYLGAMGKPVARPLVAMCPVSLREEGDREATTKVTVMCVPLGAPAASVHQRMAQVVAAFGSAKTEVKAMSKDTAMMYGISAFALAEVEAELSQYSTAVTKPMANFVLSNVPGSPHPLYLNGAQLTGSYPISALAASMGLNVTLTSYAGSMDFGLVANGISMTHLPELARHTREAFDDLRAAAKRPGTEPKVAGRRPKAPAKRRTAAKAAAG